MYKRALIKSPFFVCNTYSFKPKKSSENPFFVYLLPTLIFTAPQCTRHYQFTKH